MSDTTDDMEHGAGMYEDYMEDEEEFEFNFNSMFFWKSKSGTKRIYDMDDQHLQNCIRKIESGSIRLKDFSSYLLMKNVLLERKIAKIEKLLVGKNEILKQIKGE